jgi:hypothetical protein
VKVEVAEGSGSGGEVGSGVTRKPAAQERLCPVELGPSDRRGRPDVGVLSDGASEKQFGPLMLAEAVV